MRGASNVPAKAIGSGMSNGCKPDGSSGGIVRATEVEIHREIRAMPGFLQKNGRPPVPPSPGRTGSGSGNTDSRRVRHDSVHILTRLLTNRHLPDHMGRFTDTAQVSHQPVDRLFPHDEDHADPHVEDAEHLLTVNLTETLNPAEDRVRTPGRAINSNRAAFRKQPCNVVAQAAPPTPPRGNPR